MIKDSLKNYKNYLGISKYLDAGLNYLANTNLSSLKNGIYQIVENKVFAIVQDYNSKPLEQGKFEAHKKFIDIQYIVEGSEQIGYGEISNFEDDTEYSEEKDIVFLKEKNNNYNFTKLVENDFAIFYPQDAHMPQISVDESCFVKKIVTKVIFDK